MPLRATTISTWLYSPISSALQHMRTPRCIHGRSYQQLFLSRDILQPRRPYPIPPTNHDVDKRYRQGFTTVQVGGFRPNYQTHLWREAVARSTVEYPLVPLKANTLKLTIEDREPAHRDAMTWSATTRAGVTSDKCTCNTLCVCKDIAAESYTAMVNWQHIFADLRLGQQLVRPGCWFVLAAGSSWLLVRPGCWSYGDMLPVGYMNTTDQG
ncbi:hypothetical protein SARC_03912 [Sphaeroforma arctica JP610]|uniref:Uncharacterized protein n=1 Tax=Sphaeroforma arctica JP610 TaxID=667725 RepID=A0A0L0G475_9EUKA|nr:hypothetical protein SARC_03912 [Sphaeroforma arctica JP610]KNC83855.1 hypothetical protein SARC_03912 [Sphaeroforma arctica JP610]|eukprot:XP_014157757.1 hypothetical protein SARC_03912 [Sphaeroforma arctica JP610]